MATISRWGLVRHLRSGPNYHVLHFRGGKLVRNDRGLSFFFLPLSATIAEVPCDDRDEPFLFHGRSRDFQDVTVQGTITYRVVSPEDLARRVDFSIDLQRGHHLKTPLEQISGLLSQLAQQLVWTYLNETALRDLLAEGLDEVRRRIRVGLSDEPNMKALGLEIVSVRVARLSPTAELEKALQAPTREAIQQESDEAVFQRRAMAVEKERAIAENELRNRIELARRKEELIGQQGQNARHEAREQSEAARIRAEAAAQRRRMAALAQADGIREIEKARVGADAERMEIYRDLAPNVMLGLAARELAGNLHSIEHLNLGSDAFGPLLMNLVQSGIRQLESPNGHRVADTANVLAADTPAIGTAM